MTGSDWIALFGVLAGVGGLVVGLLSLRASAKANRIASSAVETGNRAAIAAERSAVAAEASAATGAAHLEIQLSAQAANLVVKPRSVVWNSGGGATSTMRLEIVNAGGSTADDIVAKTITVDGATHPLETPISPIPKGDSVVKELRLPFPLPSGTGQRSFRLTVRYRDALDERDEDLFFNPLA